MTSEQITVMRWRGSPELVDQELIKRFMRYWEPPTHPYGKHPLQIGDCVSVVGRIVRGRAPVMYLHFLGCGHWEIYDTGEHKEETDELCASTHQFGKISATHANRVMRDFQPVGQLSLF